jgi:hypothetical protein
VPSLPLPPPAVLPNEQGAIYVTEHAPYATPSDAELIGGCPGPELELDRLRNALKCYQTFFRLEDNEAADIVGDAILEALVDLEMLQAACRLELNNARRADYNAALDRAFERGLRAGPGVASHHLAN